MKQKISIEDFFAEESNTGFLCTIELVAKDATKVKLTPWKNETKGCNCESAITINKELIENVIVTEDVHVCCGKKHKIVEVFFKENASLKLTDVLQMTLEKAHSHNTPPPVHVPSYPLNQFKAAYQPNPLRSPMNLQPCGSGSYNPDTQCCCYDPVSGRTFISTRQPGQSDYCCCDPSLCV